MQRFTSTIQVLKTTIFFNWVMLTELTEFIRHTKISKCLKRETFALVLMTLSFSVLQAEALASDAASSEQQETVKIQQVLRDYIDGSAYNDRQKIANAFHPDADLLLERDAKPFNKIPLAEYLGWYKPENQGKFNGRVGEIVQIDVSDKLAQAKVEIIIPTKKTRFVDVILLKKINDRWQIISKAASQEVSQKNAQRILFIVSNAHFHGKSQLPAGASFSEIVNAYHVFKAAGYTVEFVSPEGGAIPLAYIDTSNPLHKQYLYDSEFMFALKNTKNPSQLEAKDFRAVHYIGGSSAMYGVAENVGIAQLVMDIYEKHNGIISSVCHGTAGIVYLKTNDGKYLVAGKRISGYPEDFEKPNAEYFKQFPFLIKRTVQQHEGSFHFGRPDESYVEIDGRVITGQNWQSSAPVAKAIIRLLQEGAPSSN